MIGHDGQPTVVANAVCVHEEDAGVLWRHADWRSELAHVRRSRRWSFSWANLGNYDYGFFWYFYLDGTIEAEVKLTGVPAAAAHQPGQRTTHGALVAADLSAPHHQHLFCFRLDLDIDGVENTIEEVELVTDPYNPDNPSGAAFHTEATPLNERDAVSRRLSCAGRFWKVQRRPRPQRGWRTDGLRPDSWRPTGTARRHRGPVARRAEFARHHLWVTQHADGELHAAGDYPNQHPGGDGLPAFTAGNRSLERHRRRVVVHLRIEPRRPPGGLAGDARGVRRIPPPARRLLRPQPGARRATTGPHQPERTLPVTVGGKRDEPRPTGARSASEEVPEAVPLAHLVRRLLQDDAPGAHHVHPGP